MTGLRFLVSCAGVATTLSYLSVSAHAQTPINQPVSDEFGVERKTGRALFPLPTVISIGDEGGAQLSIPFVHVDGSSLGIPTIPGRASEAVSPPYGFYSSNPQAMERYVATTITYGGINERFRQLWNGTSYNTAITSEYPTGSTFDGTTFVDKHGLKIIFTNLPDGVLQKVEYPDGRTIQFESSFSNKLLYIKNNFGYALKTEVRGGWYLGGQPNDPYKMTFQGVNQTRDYCDLKAVALCSNLTKNRQGSYEGVKGTVPLTATTSYSYIARHEFTDAAGNVTKVRNALIAAPARPPICYTTSTYSYNGSGTTPTTITNCDNPPLEYRPYPVGLTPPGSTTENYNIEYNVPTTSIYATNSHDNVRITKVIKQGSTINYNSVYYKPSGSYGGVAYSPSWVWVTASANGQELSYSQSYQLHPFWGQTRRVLNFVRDGAGKTTNYPYNQLWELSGVTYPEGDGLSYGYDTRQNIISVTQKPKTGSTAQPLVTTYTYLASCAGIPQARCNKPLTVTDPRGNVTNYQYNDRGQVTVEMKPAPVPGAARPTITNSYTLRTAYIKDSNGNPIAAGQPVSLLTRTSTCQTLASCAGTNDEVVTEYDYGPLTGLNNLSLRGVSVTAVNEQGQMQTLRTCYQYNYFGERIAETQANAGATSCS